MHESGLWQRPARDRRRTQQCRRRRPPASERAVRTRRLSSLRVSNLTAAWLDSGTGTATEAARNRSDRCAATGRTTAPPRSAPAPPPRHCGRSHRRLRGWMLPAYRTMRRRPRACAMPWRCRGCARSRNGRRASTCRWPGESTSNCWTVTAASARPSASGVGTSRRIPRLTASRRANRIGSAFTSGCECRSDIPSRNDHCVDRYDCGGRCSFGGHGARPFTFGGSAKMSGNGKRSLDIDFPRSMPNSTA